MAAGKITFQKFISSTVYREAEPLTWMFWKKRRYIVVLLAFLGYFSSYSLRVNLSVAIVVMTAKDETGVNVNILIINRQIARRLNVSCLL